MLFNLSKRISFPSLKTGKDICCSKFRGPSFRGGDYSELCASYAPFKDEGLCDSYPNSPSYEIPVVGEGINKLTN